MKTITKLIVTGALASGLTTTSGLLAQEGNKGKKNAKAVKAEGKAAAQTDAKGYLGVGFSEVPDALRAHLQIDEGVGLLVEHLDPEGPALAAGMKPHDIVVELDDQIITGADQLVVLVRNREPGSNASVKIYRKGAEMDIPVTVGAAPAGATDTGATRPSIFQMQGGPAFSFKMDFDQDDIGKSIREQMKAQGIDLGSQVTQIGGNGIDLQKLLGKQLGQQLGITISPGATPNGGKSDIRIINSSATSINIIDDEHTISLNGSDDDLKLVAKAKDGTVLYDGPYNTDAEKAKVAKPVREKLENARGMVDSGKKKVKPEAEEETKGGTKFSDGI